MKKELEKELGRTIGTDTPMDMGPIMTIVDTGMHHLLGGKKGGRILDSAIKSAKYWATAAVLTTLAMTAEREGVTPEYIVKDLWNRAFKEGRYEPVQSSNYDFRRE